MGVDLSAISPLLAVTSLALLVLVVESLTKKSGAISFWMTFFGLLICIGITLGTLEKSGMAFNNMITVGGYGSFLSTLFLIAALLSVVLSRDYLQKEEGMVGEYYILIIFATLGMMLMAFAADLITIFLGIELMSVSLYVLAGFKRKRMVSNESALKYFLLGAFATGFLLYGIALLYGSAGTTNILLIIEKFPALSGSSLFWGGLGLLMVGFAFKVGAVPFHMWVPDVYQGSPTTVSGFMSTGAKAAAFSAFVLVFAHEQFWETEKIKTTLAVISAASMIVGNIIAISQSNIKRMLAYSSIAHAGYMLAGLAAGNQLGRSGVLFYLVTYTFMNIGAFGVVSLFEKEEEKNLTFDDYAGMGSKKPMLAAIMSVFMLSLAGIPPFAGFLGKYYVFLAAVNGGLTWLAIIGVLASVVSVYYYLRLLVVMYFQESTLEFSTNYSMLSFAVLLLAVFIVIELGIFPSSILSIINSI